MFRSMTGQLFYEAEFNAEFVKENFTKLRNIILTTQDEFIEFIILNNISEYIEKDFSQVKDILETKEIIDTKVDIRTENQDVRHPKSHNMYIQVIVYLTLQFIMGQFVESLDEDLYQATQVVNATASEFMELIIRSISPYSHLCTEIMHMILNPLIQTLRIAIDNKNDAQQVILLNLLKVILFENERRFFS